MGLSCGDVVLINFSSISLFWLKKATGPEWFVVQGKYVRGVKLRFQEQSFQTSGHAVFEIPNGSMNFVAFHMDHIITHCKGHASKSDAALVKAQDQNWNVQPPPI